ncbi:MAG: NHL repeat-containing protein [Candidatus Acidiferrales bacterium]
MNTRISAACAIVAVLGLASVSRSLHFHAEAETRTTAGPPLEFIGSWGARGDGPGHLLDPVSIATDTIGNIYIADLGSRFVHKFGPQGKPLLSFQEDPMKHPQSVAVDSGGAIYVTDPVRKSVFICLPSGERDRYHELRLKTHSGKENVLSVGVADDGLIYVFDSNAGKIMAFNARSRLVETWQPRPDSTGPNGPPGTIAVASDTSVYVSDIAGSRILKFTRDGRYVSEFGSSASRDGWKLSDRFAISANNIFAMDTDGRMLHVWTMDGAPKLDMDLAPELGQAPRSAPPIAISPRGELLILDVPEARVLRYRINF